MQTLNHQFFKYGEVDISQFIQLSDIDVFIDLVDTLVDRTKFDNLRAVRSDKAAI